MTLEIEPLWWKIFRWWVRIAPSSKMHRQLIEALSEHLSFRTWITGANVGSGTILTSAGSLTWVRGFIKAEIAQNT